MPGWTKWLARGKAVPWVRLYVLGEWAYRKGRAAHGGLTASERSDLGHLLRKSKGRRSNLSDRERTRLQSLTVKALKATRGA